MEKFTKLLCLSLLIFILGGITGAKDIKFKGDYFIYSQDKNFMYGAGKISIISQNLSITGQTLFLDANAMKGKLFGSIVVKEQEKIIAKGDELVFDLFPLKYLCKSFDDFLTTKGNLKPESEINLIEIGELKQSSIFYELKSFIIKTSKKISGQYVIPYLMGIPSIPVKKLVINKGDLSKKTIFYLTKTNYSQTYGLSVDTGLNIYHKNYKGNFKIKFFERGLFKISGNKRGLIVDGKNSIQIKDNKLLDFNLLANSDNNSFNFSINHTQDFKHLNYSVSHSVSGRKGNESFHLLNTSLRIKKLKFIIPQFNFSYDYKGSTTFKISSPLKLMKQLILNFGWERNIVNNDLKRNDSVFNTTLNFSSSILSLSSSFNFSKDLIESTHKKSFSLNLNLPDLKFLDDNFSFRLSPFFTFSSIPSESYQFKESSPGINFSINSRGVLFPLGIKLYPNFNMYQIWDSINNNKTNFNYTLSLKKTFSNITLALDYGLVSRFSTNSYWVEGYNMNSLSLRIETRKLKQYFLSSRFGYNNEFKLENITVIGEIFLPLKSKLSTSLIYYNLQKQLATFEIYLEKSFRGVFKIRGGYSLALKRFFIDLVHTI